MAEGVIKILMSLRHFVCLGGTPKGRGAGHPGQISASLSGGNPVESYICNSPTVPICRRRRSIWV